MEEGYYWIEIKESKDRWGSEGPTIGEYNGGWWFICGSEEVIDPKEVTVGPRVKGQEECQSDD